MSKKITKEVFQERFEKIFTNAKYEIIEYTAISKPCVIKCLKCGKIHKYSSGNKALSTIFCCENISRLESILKRLEGTEYNFVKQINKDEIVIKHNKCGTETIRNIGSAFKDPFSCKYCRSSSLKNLDSIETVQQELDKIFNGNIVVLEYNGKQENNLYKCTKCGLNFRQKHVRLVKSKGCPKCDRKQSLGEQKIRTLLERNGIKFKEQVKIPELGLQKFDFAVYDSEDKIQYFIECQGDQHFKRSNYFRDDLSVIQERDERKRRYCKKMNIPLYEIIYIKGKFKNLNILPFLTDND